jgi:hypothetical protein
LSVCGKFSHIPTLPTPRHEKIKYMLELNNTSDSEMEALGEGLAHNDKIEEVHLLYNMLSSQGLKTLSSWLGESRTKLRKLHMIGGAQIDSDGAMALLGAIQKNPRWLEIIELPRGTEYRLEIQHFADLNKVGFAKMFRDKRNWAEDLALWPYVIQRANNLIHCKKSKKENENRRANTIFHLLRGPATLHTIETTEPTKQSKTYDAFLEGVRQA